jgi:hypothetical protein
MSKEIKIVKYIPCNWFNSASNSLLFGIDGVDKDGNVYHTLSDGSPLMYTTKKARNEKIRELKSKLK